MGSISTSFTGFARSVADSCLGSYHHPDDSRSKLLLVVSRSIFALLRGSPYLVLNRLDSPPPSFSNTSPASSGSEVTTSRQGFFGSNSHQTNLTPPPPSPSSAMPLPVSPLSHSSPENPPCWLNPCFIISEKSSDLS